MIYIVYHSPEGGAGMVPCLDEASAKEQVQVLKDVGIGLFTIIEGGEIHVEGAWINGTAHEAETS